MPLDRFHLTTMQFGQIVPLYEQAVLPGDHFKVDVNIFSRCAPLVVPLYGDAQVRSASFFVPYYQIAEDFEAFYAGKSTAFSKTPYMRNIRVRDLVAFFVTSNNKLVTTVTEKPASYHFCYTNASGTLTYATFTPLGKYYYKICCALGYVMPTKANLSSDAPWNKDGGFGYKPLNAMPLLSFFKAYNDWMSQSQRFNSSEMTKCLEQIRTGETGVWYQNGGFITSAALKVLFSNLLLCYENDYFTSAWAMPNSALNTYENLLQVSFVQDYDNVTAEVTKGLLTASNIGVMADTDNKDIQQRQLDFLNRFDSWVRRNNYAGSRDVQMIYARFGIKPENFRSRYAFVLGTHKQPLQIGDVTSMAQTQDAPLGSYAGKGITSGECSFETDINDIGHIVTLSWIYVKPCYFEGYSREVLKSTPVDFYQPEFDGLQANPISFAEVCVNPKDDSLSSDTKTDDSVYGFTENYNEYRTSRDIITGDFRLYPELESWHFGRNLVAIREANKMFAQTASMNCYPQTGSEFNRIFADTTDNEDKFYLESYQKVTATRNMLNNSEATGLPNGNLDVSRNGNEIS